VVTPSTGTIPWMRSFPVEGPLSVTRFRWLWTASVFSNVGSFLQAVAASWLMLELTDSPLWVGAMVASSTLPLLFLALVAGALADLVNRRSILLASQVTMGAAAAAMAALWYADAVTPPLLLSLGLLLGVGIAFNMPAWQALVPDLVPRGMVASAVALNSASFNVARATGPALGGILVATAGPGLAFAINAVSYAGVIAVIASFPATDWTPERESSLGSAIALGIRFARFTAPFRWLLGVAAAFALTSAAVQTMLPNVSRDVLSGDAGLYGILLGAMGAGALVGASTRRPATDRLGRATVPVSIAAFGVAGVVVGLSRLPLLTGLAMAAAGVTWVWALATLNATTQLLSPAWVRGRAMSLYSLAFVGILPLGSLLAGALGDTIGPAEATAVLSGGAIVLGLVALRLPLPGLDDVESPELPEDWDMEPHGDTQLLGGPVMVASTWVIDESDLDEFLEVMNQLRLARMRTGAYRWRLYRNAGDVHRMTEMFLLASWEDHLRQHQRIDAAAAALIRRARAFDVDGGPVTHHLVAVDVVDPELRPGWDELVARHGDYHRRDGSIPLEVERAPADRLRPPG
jgi:MFS family permease